MNKIHRLVWSARLGQCVAVSEVTGSAGARCGSSAGRRKRRLAAASASAWALSVLGAAVAQTAPAPTTLPKGGQVVQGQASLRGAGNAAVPVLNIDQSSRRAVIDWSSFDLGSAATVNFNQPNAQSATLNRVQDVNPSRIFGHIHATGQVTLINPSGVYFSPSAVLDVGALTATTMQQNDADFMAGGASFTRGGSTGSVVNAGRLQAGLGGFIALLAPQVRNEGLIVARQGTVALASGEAIRLNFDPQDRLTSLTVSPSRIAALVENKTAVQVGGGQILLSATALSGLQGSVVNSGQLGASSLTAKGGRIVLEGDVITLTAGSAITASGATGGGTVLVGGDWQGAAGTYQATTVTMAAGASIEASATQQGDGGKVVLWSDVHRPASVTTVNGRITARGIAGGGQVETSGHTVVMDTAQVDAGGQARAGLWLIDPYDYTIGVGEAATIGASLSSGTSVAVDTSLDVAGHGSLGNAGDAGNINVNDNISKIDGVDATLTLRAHNDIVMAANVAITSTSNRLNVVFNSDLDGSGAGAIRLNIGSSITSNGGNITLGGGTAGDGSGNAVGSIANDYGLAVVGATLNAGTGNISLRGKGGTNAGNQKYGVDLGSGAQISTTDGNISMVGTGGGSAGTGDHDGLRVGSATVQATGTGSISIQGTGGVGAAGNSDGVVGYSSLGIVQTASGNLSITGTGNGPGTDSDGIYLKGTTVGSASGSITLTGTGASSAASEGVVIFNNASVSATAGGSIGITGIGGGTGAAADGVTLQSSTINAASGSVTIVGTLASGSSGASSGIQVASSSTIQANGALSLTGAGNGTAGSHGVELGTSSSVSTLNANPLGITTDSYIGDGSETVSAGTGTVTLQNRSAGTRIDLGGADVLTGSPLTLGLGSAELDRITAGQLVVGRNDASASGAMAVSSAIAPASTSRLTLKTGAGMTFDAAVTLGSSSGLTLTAAGNVSQTVGANLTATQLLLNGPGNYALATAAANAVGDIAAAGAGAVGFRNSGALRIGTAGGVNGIGASGPVSIGTSSGDLSVAQGVATSDTSTSAVLLNAGVASAAGTATGGNIVFSGSPGITTGGGGRATFYTGSISESSGVSAWVGSGSGHFRYDSDEVASNFSTAISGGGRYAIYREQPTMTMTGAAASMVYGASVPTPLASASGAVNGDVIAATATVGGSTSTAGHYTVAGPHTVTPETAVAIGLGYAVNATNGALTVTPVGLTVAGSTASNKVYDKTAAATVTGGTLVGVLGADVLTLTQAGTFASVNVGNGIAVSGNDSLGGADAGNYVLTQPSGLSANITPKPLTVAGSVANHKVYDKTTAATVTGGTLVGVLGGDTVTLTQAGNFTGVNVGNGIGVTASDSLGGADVGNYSLTQPSGLSANITPKELTVAGSAASHKVYDKTTAATVTGGTLVGVLGGDAVTLTQAGNFATANVGNGIAVSAADSVSGGDVGNYFLTQPGGLSADITPKPLTITGSTASDKVYDRTTTATVGGGVLIGVIAGDAVTLTQAGSFATANAGNAIAVTPSNTVGGADVGNYTLTQPAALSANITPKPLTVSGSVASDKVYDKTTTATLGGGTLVGVIGGDTVTLTQAGSFATANAGSGILVIANDSLGGADIGNYSLTQPAGVSASITPKPLTLHGASGLAKTYDGSTFLSAAGYGALGGVIAGDPVLVQGTAAYAAPNVGSQAVVQGSVALTGPGAGNYRLAWVDGTGSIAPAQLTVVANNDARFVVQADTAGYNGVTYSGFVNGDTAAVLAGSAVITRSNAGTNGAGVYAGVLVPGGLSAANYTIAFVRGDYTIVPANQLLVRVPNVQSTYGTSVIYGPAQASYLASDNSTIVDLSSAVSSAGNTLSVTDGASGMAGFTVSPVNARASGSGALAVGAYQLGASQVTATSANFSNNLVVVGAHQVDAKGITLAPGGVSKVYDGTLGIAGLQLAATGLVAGDSAAPAGTGEFATRNAGTGLSYSVTGLHLDGADAGNYYVIGGSSLSGTGGSILPKVLTLTAPVVTKVYDGNALYPADAATLAGLSTQLGVAGDSLTGVSLVFDDKNVATGKTLTPSAAAIADGNGGNNYVLSYATSQGSSITRLSSVTWVGGPTGNWFDPANWAGGAVPDLANVANVVIPQNVTVNFGSTVVGPAQAGAVQIDSLGTAGALDLQAGQLIVGGGGIRLGALTQSGGSLGSVGNVALGSFDQSGGSLATDGNFGTTGNFAQTGAGTVAVGGSTQIVDTNGGTTLGNLASTGPLTVTSSGGPITQQPGTVVTAIGSTSLTASSAGTPADITLAGANQLGGPVSATGANLTLANAAPLTLASAVATGNLNVQSQGALNLGTSLVGGNLTADSAGGDITSSGPLKVSGRTVVDAGTGHVRLLDHGNWFGGPREGHGTTVRIYPFDDVVAPIPVPVTEISGVIQAGLAASARRSAAHHPRWTEAGCGPMMQVEAGSADGAPETTESIGQLADSSSFEFELPAASARALREHPGLAVARRADGAALPAWLVFDAERLRLHGVAVPAGGLPIELAVQAGRHNVRLTIATRFPNGRSCRAEPL